MSRQLRTEGTDILSLHGVPYWLPPDHVLDAAARATRELPAGDSRGLSGLRKAIAQKLNRDNQIDADPAREIVVTNAAMHALNVVFISLLDPGDEVLMFSPRFFYYGALELAGAVPIFAETRQESNWSWDVRTMEERVSPRTKMIILNTPANPTGYAATLDDLLAVADLAHRRDLLVLSDEAYDSMIYDGVRHLSFASLDGVKERSIMIYSLTKSYAMPLWRTGFIVAPAHLTPSICKVLEWNVLSCNHVAQRAAQTALEGPQDWVGEIGQRFEHCRDLMVEGLKSVPGISFVIPKGGPFLFLNISQLGVSSEEFCMTLLSEYGVPCDPGSFFGSDSHVRLEFGGDDSVVREAARRIASAARESLARSEIR